MFIDCIDLTNESTERATYKNIADVQGLQTLYRVVNTNPNGVPKQVLYPSGTRENLKIWTSNVDANSAEIVGYVCDFEFPNTVNQLRIDMTVKTTITDKAIYLVGFGGSDANKRYTCPAISITTDRKIDFGFSANGTSWSIAQGLSTVTVNDNEKTLLGFELVINDDGKVVKNIYKNGILAWTLTTDDTAIAKPYNNGMSLFYRISGLTNKWYINNLSTDLTQLKITVNNEVKANGSNF